MYNIKIVRLIKKKQTMNPNTLSSGRKDYNRMLELLCFWNDYFGFVLYCDYLDPWGIVAVDVRFFKLGKGTSLSLGSVFGLVAWVDFCFWI